jgi:putative tricarboxylic transport membrane protein
MNLRDQLSSLFWLAISIFVCVEAVKSSVGSFKVPGPGFLPFWSGVILGTLAIILMVTNYLKKNGAEKRSPLWKGIKWWKVPFVLISFFIYAILLNRLGYLITTFGLMFFLLGMMGRIRLWVQLANALITAGVTYVIFSGWLSIPLPKGIFGF